MLLMSSGSFGLFFSASSNFVFAAPKSLLVKSAVPRRWVSRKATGSIRDAGATGAGVSAACGTIGAGVPAATGRLGAGCAVSSTPFPESSSVMAMMMTASDATVPKISVPPPSRLISGGSGSSGFLYATSGA
jgi:hypothetical protein